MDFPWFLRRRRRPLSQLLVIFLTLPLAGCFNLDVHGPIHKSGPHNSHFGYSIASHFHGSTPTVLVGAPHGESGQRGTKRAGALYSCPISSSSSDCSQVRAEYRDPHEYEKTPDNARAAISQANYYLGKNGQLFGATVVSQGRVNGSALVCSPLSSFHNTSAFNFGACYKLNGLELSDVLVSCYDEHLRTSGRHNDYGACNQGFSAVIDDDLLATGMVGARTWTGGVFARTIPHKLYEDAQSKHSMIDETESKDAVRTVFKSHDYVGFSLGVGRFGFAHEDGEKQTLVSGATRFGQHGAVLILPFHRSSKSRHLLLTEDHFVLNGTQLGSGFGYSVEVVDLNGDGFDDLLVGAPFERHSDEFGVFGGAVRVFFSQGQQRSVGQSSVVFHQPVVLRKAGLLSQYGFALAKLGNLDGDPSGFQDFAVGAPFANEGSGAVFIYHGAKSPGKLSTTPVQEILPNLLPSGPRIWRSFGSSLSGNVDVDGNGYPDLAVGSALVDTMTFLRARPVIRIVTQHESDKNFTEIERKEGCPSRASTCLILKLGMSVEKTESTKLINLNSDVFVCTLEVVELTKGVQKRALIESSGSTSETWPCGRNAHQRTIFYSHTLFIPRGDSSGDWLNPLKFRFSVKLSGEKKPLRVTEGEALPDLQKYPMLDSLHSVHMFTVPFNTRCGADHVCVSDLSLQALIDGVFQKDGVYELSVGEQDYVDVNFAVVNKGEKAYDAALWVSFDPEELESPSIERGTKKNGLVLETVGDNVVIVKLGNPMQSGHNHRLTIRFKLVRGRSQGLARPLFFSASVNSTSEEAEPADNEWTAQLRVIKRAELELTGASEPPLVHFGGDVKAESDMELEEDIGPMVRHNYTLHNKSKWTLRNLTITVEWPSQVEGGHRRGKWALYLLDFPTITTLHTDGTQEVKPCSVEDQIYNINSVEHIRRNTIYSTLAVQPSPSDGYRRRKRSALPENEGVLEGKAFASQLFKKIPSKNRIQPKKRQEFGGEVDVVSITCAERTAKCIRITCLLDYVDAGAAPVVDIRARLWNATFVEDYFDVEFIEIASRARVEIDAVQGVLDDNVDNNEISVVTVAYPDKPSMDEARAIPWWVLALAVAAGLVILLLLVLLLWRCGFFQRKRPVPNLYTAQLRKHERDQWEDER